MVSRTLVVALAAGTVFAGAAMGSPDPKLSGKKIKHRPMQRSFLKSGGGVIAAIPFNDNFDSYKAGSKCSENGTWELWDPASSPDGTIVDHEALSDPNSLQLETLSDNVQRTGAGTITSGQWTLKTMVYFPTSSLGQGGGMLIGLNTFQPPTFNWSFDIGLDYSSLTGKVILADDPNGVGIKQLPILLDQWVELRVEIDLDADNFSAYYNGENFVDKRSWTQGASGNGILEIQCIDFYSSGCSGMLYDDVSLSESGGCYADCDDSGELDIDDFICFQTLFGFGDPGADCDGSGELDIDDFICYQTAFGFGDDYADCDGSGELDIDDFICFQTAFGIGCGG